MMCYRCGGARHILFEKCIKTLKHFFFFANIIEILFLNDYEPEEATIRKLRIVQFMEEDERNT